MQRNAGLDVARSAAIGLVIVAHYSLFASGRFDIGPILIGAGYFGVELFFVLSGFLIGRILIRDVLPDASFRALSTFWKRRWLRTLPAYYLVWLVLFSFTGSWSVDAPYLLFLQHWTGEQNFFGVSWSLVIEEWFYLTVPLVAVALCMAGYKPKRVVLTLCILGIVLCPIARRIVAEHDWMGIRKSVFIRMDAVLFGLLLAWLFTYKTAVFQLLARFAPIALIVLAICAWQFVHLKELHSLGNKTLLFTATDASFVPILAWLEGRSVGRRNARIAEFISVTSYSVYLIHWDIMQFFRSHVPAIGHHLGIVVSAATGLVVTYVAAYLLHRYWEQPWLRLRDLRPLANVEGTRTR